MEQPVPQGFKLMLMETDDSMSVLVSTVGFSSELICFDLLLYIFLSRWEKYNSFKYLSKYFLVF